MLEINIRVATFCVDLPACHNALNYFLRSWKLNAGPYYANTAFTIKLPEGASRDTLAICHQLAASYPIQISTITADTAASYRNFWPLSFLDEAYDEELVIYCPPHTLVSHDLSSLIERIVLQDCVRSSLFTDSDAKTYPLPMWLAAFPRSSRPKLSGKFPVALTAISQATLPADAFQETIRVMAQAFDDALRNSGVSFSSLDQDELCLLDSDQNLHAHECNNALFISLTDAPANRFSWSGVFSSFKSIQGFLDDTELSDVWLNCQRNLRRIHHSLDTAPFFLKRTFFKANKAPYYIFALDFIQQSAGIRALHYLCHALNESGQEAYVTCEKTVPHLRTPVLTEETMVRHHDAGSTPIMVYPEIVSGNPFGAKVVARWLLNKPGHIGGDTQFAEDELIFTFDPLYLVDGMNGETLHIPTSDLSLFNNEDNADDVNRQQVCFYAHKYLAAGGQLAPHLNDAISLGKDQQLSHPQIAEILRNSKVLYVYEPTALISEALLCGCPVSILVTDYWRSHVANYSYTSDWGVVMDNSPESIALATTNVTNYRTFYEDVVLKNAWAQVDHFIELTQLAAKDKQPR